MKFLEPTEYQPLCINRFDFYKIEVQKLLPKARVEHIGASAVPNAVSKGDLDIFIGVTDLEHAVASLKILDYSEKQNTLRTDDLCMLESLSEDVALQVVANDSEFEDFLHFREKLREDPKLVEEYNHLKRSCEGFNQDKYRKIKSEFIERILR
jgi:GrpB-like predicted nucleotidyltransferase (UPF0157 family)